jgi:hypothetical protein
LFTDIGLMDEPQAGLELVDRRRFDVAWPLARLAGKAASATKGRSNRENRSASNPMQRRCVDRPASPSDPLRQFRDQYPGGFMGKREPSTILKTDERSIHLELGREPKFKRQLKRLA